MPYLPDLSPYQSNNTILGHARSVGWLDRDQPFRRGPVPLAFAHELQRLAAAPVELSRGCHVCAFCHPPRDIIALDPHYEEVWEMFRCGNGEIHITGEAGDDYIAPALIAHYVGEHQYQPPAEFVAAVMYQRRLRTITPPERIVPTLP